MVDVPESSEENPEVVMKKMQKEQAIFRLSTVIEETPSKEFTRQVTNNPRESGSPVSMSQREDQPIRDASFTLEFNDESEKK